VLPAANAGTVEAEAVFERALFERTDGQAEVLPCAGKIDEFEVEHTRLLVARKLKDLLWSSLLHHTTLLGLRDFGGPVRARSGLPGDPKNVFYRG
jgi:hypothetical protein